MAKNKNVTFQWIDNKHALLSFKELQKLEFSEDKFKGFVKFGKDNLYPQEYIRLYNEHPEHRAIINRKARYIWGKGLKAVKPEDEIKVNAFIDSFNKKETLNQVGKRITKNTEIFNGVYIEVITNLLGKPIEYHMLNSANCRVSPCENILYFCKNWKTNTRLEDVKEINLYKDGVTAGTYFIPFKYYNPSADHISSTYPVPEYQSVVSEVNTDINISTFNAKYVDNGFSVGTIISFFNGTPSPQMIKDIDLRFKGKYAGPEGDNILITHGDESSKKPEVTTIGVEELAEKFSFTSKRAQKKIFAGHEIPSELFNIKFEDSFLSGSPDLLTLQEMFVKGYVELRQPDLLEFFSYLAFLKTGEYLEMEFEQASLIGADLSNDQDLTQDERRKLKGYEPLIKPKVDAAGNELPVEASEINDNLKGLSASENADMIRVVRDFQKGRNGMNEHMAITRLKAFGLNELDAKKMLGIQMKMSSQVDKVLMALEACAEDDNEDETILIEMAHIHNSKDALKYERQIMKFADALTISVSELDSAVLNSLKGNPTMSASEIAKALNYDVNKISESIDRLVLKGFLEGSAGNFTPTSKGLNKDTEPPKSYEIYTVYKYALRDDAPSLVPGGSSRDFCKKLMGLSKSKNWKFETIDNMENDLGTNVWDYRGGYYTNPVSKNIEPDCRHVWQAITKRRLVK